MSAAAEKTEGAAPKKAAATADQNKIVKVKNTSGGNINTSQGVIEPGKEGKATIAELRSYNKYLEKA
jgi:hypothetical protein